MKGYKIPIYRNGTLLTTEMMETMKELVVHLTTYPFNGYADGIISGTEVIVNKGILYVKKGMIKYKDAIFFLPDDIVVPLRPINEWQIIKLVIGDKEMESEFESIEIDITSDTNSILKENEIEICRLRLQNGANLRSEYRNFSDLETEFDTVRLIEAKWAAYGENGIHPRILQEFVKETRKYLITEPADVSFMMQIQNMQGRTCERGLIESYLNIRLGQSNTAYSNLEIYQGLCQVRKMIKDGRGMKVNQRPDRRIFVD